MSHAPAWLSLFLGLRVRRGLGPTLSRWPGRYPRVGIRLSQPGIIWRTPYARRPRHARSSDRRHRTVAHRPGVQGLARSASARTTWPRRSWRRRWPRCRSSIPADIERPDARLRPARRRAGLQHGPGGRGAARTTISLPGTTVNRYCSSSLQTTRMAFHAIKAGEGDVFISAGRRVREPVRQGQQRFAGPTRRTRSSRDAQARTEQAAAGRRRTVARPARGRARCPDIYIAMGQTAENVAELRGITREQQDEFGVRSQNLAEKAIANGFWQREITPVTLPDGTVVAADDGPRPGTTIEKVGRAEAGLPPGRHGDRGQLLPAQRRRGRGRGDERRQGGRARHHAARADRVVRGDRAVSGDHGPGTGGGVPPGAGRAGMAIADIDLVEINEAFAAQVIPSYTDLGIDIDKLNVNGGAIAVGHPFGMTGARITTTLLNSLQFHDKTLGLETMCVGGGQGMAMIFERLS